MWKEIEPVLVAYIESEAVNKYWNFIMFYGSNDYEKDNTKNSFLCNCKRK